MTQETKKKVLNVLGKTGNVLLWIFLIFAFVLTVVVLVANANSDGVPSLFGKSFVTIQSPSMEPTYKEGNLVFLDKIDEQEKYNLQKDMIITFKCDINNDGIQDLKTHRISNVISPGIYETWGDNRTTNPTPDETYVMAMDIVGTSTEGGKLPLLGGILDFIRGPVGFFIFVVLPLAVFFLYELYRFIALIISERNKNKPVTVDAATEEEIKQRAIEEYLASRGITPPNDSSNTAAPANAGSASTDTSNEETNATTETDTVAPPDEGDANV